MLVDQSEFMRMGGTVPKPKESDLHVLVSAINDLRRSIEKAASAESSEPPDEPPIVNVTVPAPNVSVSVPEQKIRPPSAYRFNISRDSSGMISSITATPI